MKNGNWIGFIWAAFGFALIGLGLDNGSQTIQIAGWVILSSWLVFVFWSYLKK